LIDSAFENASGFEIGLNLIVGCTSRLPWKKSLSTSIRRLRERALAAPLSDTSLSSAKKFTSLALWGGRYSDKILVESPIPYNEKGYNEPKAIPVPLTFFTNGWNVFLSGKQTHAFLALIYQSMQQPLRGAYFVAPSEREKFGLVARTYQRVTAELCGLNLIQPVDENRYAHRAGRGATHDTPNEFKIMLETLKSTPPIRRQN